LAFEIETLCPLCRSPRHSKEEEIRARDLTRLYDDFLGESTGEIFGKQETICKLRCRDCDLTFFHPAIVGGKRLYSLLQKKTEYYPGDKEEYSHALRFISKDDEVLEIGCGTGEFGKRVENYTGLDINEEALVEAREKGLQVVSQSLDDHALENPNKYDVVCAFQVLEHMGSPREFIKGCVACLRENGKVIFSVPSADSFIVHSQNHLLNLPPHHQTWWTDKALRNIETVLPVQLIDITHEKVQDQHLESFVYVLYKEMLNRFIPCRRGSIIADPGILDKVVHRACEYLCKRTIDLFSGMSLRPNGHTVTAVYRKKG
jgi:2-polyprenyl-3-methyl-5-hydroxy-6-metoxy-1,4-benzoquinol methylase